MNQEELDKLHWEIIDGVTKYFDVWDSQHYNVLGYGVKEIINKCFREAEK